MALFEHTSSNLSRRERQLRRELKDMRDQIASLSRSLGDVGHGVYVDAASDAKDFFKGIRKDFRRSRPFWRKKERQVSAFVEENPIAIAAAVGGVVVLGATFLFWAISRGD